MQRSRWVWVFFGWVFVCLDFSVALGFFISLLCLCFFGLVFILFVCFCWGFFFVVLFFVRVWRVFGWLVWGFKYTIAKESLACSR